MKIIRKILDEKTPLWFIVTIFAYLFPVFFINQFLPTFGGLWWTYCGLAPAVCTQGFPEINMEVFVIGQLWTYYLIQILFYWAIFVLFWDHIIPELKSLYRRGISK